MVVLELRFSSDVLTAYTRLVPNSNLWLHLVLKHDCRLIKPSQFSSPHKKPLSLAAICNPPPLP